MIISVFCSHGVLKGIFVIFQRSLLIYENENKIIYNK